MTAGAVTFSWEVTVTFPPRPPIPPTLGRPVPPPHHIISLLQRGSFWLLHLRNPCALRKITTASTRGLLDISFSCPFLNHSFVPPQFSPVLLLFDAHILEIAAAQVFLLFVLFKKPCLACLCLSPEVEMLNFADFYPPPYRKNKAWVLSSVLFVRSITKNKMDLRFAPYPKKWQICIFKRTKIGLGHANGYVTVSN